MLFYLDYNVYGLLADRGHQQEFIRYLRERHNSVLTSIDVLIEAQRAPEEVRSSRESAIRQIARHFAHPPSVYLECREVVTTLQRIHPDWLLRRPDLRRSKELLRGRLALWTSLKTSGSLNMDLSTWLSLTEPAMKENTELQKHRRQLELTGNALELTFTEPELLEKLESMPTTERYWRALAQNTYWLALQGDPSRQDLCDWLMPYSRWGHFSQRQWAEFWLLEVPAAYVRRNRIAHLISYYQTLHRITHGNDMDAAHAAHVFDCDAFLTCDRDFHSILVLITGGAGARVAAPVLVDRGAQDAVSAIDIALREQGVSER